MYFFLVVQKVYSNDKVQNYHRTYLKFVCSFYDLSLFSDFK